MFLALGWIEGVYEYVGIYQNEHGNEDDSRRDKFIKKYFQDAKPNQVVAILKAPTASASPASSSITRDCSL